MKVVLFMFFLIQVLRTWDDFSIKTRYWSSIDGDFEQP